jgi:hypothetical protein
MKKILSLGMIMIAGVIGLITAREVAANHSCGNTCDQFTAEGNCTHGCWGGGDPNPSFHQDEPQVPSAPAEWGTDGGNQQVAQQTVQQYNDYISTGNQASNYQIDPDQHQGATDTNGDKKVTLGELVNQQTAAASGGDTSGQAVESAGSGGCDYCGGANQGGCDEQPSTRGFKCSFGCDVVNGIQLQFCRSSGSCQVSCPAGDDDIGPASSNPQVYAKLKGVPYDPKASPAPDYNNYEYITYTCSRCSAGGKCETGSGENPSFSFGANFGACSQVDSRPKGSTGGWNALSLCSSSCSAEVGIMSVGGPPPEGGGPTPTPIPGLACTSLNGSTLTPDLGQSVTLTCNAPAAASVDHFEFRYKIGSGAFINLPAGTAQSGGGGFIGTSQLTVGTSGNYEAQCRVCQNAAGTACTSWGMDQ